MTKETFRERNWDVIQGGMGVAVSDYRLARATGRSAVGIFSGTAIAEVLSRRLQDGDPTGEMREALATFPNQAIADRALRLFFQEHGERPHGQSLWYRQLPMFNHNTRETSITVDMTVLGAYAEAYLARIGAGPNGKTGLNLLTKLDRPNMHVLAGAMMGGIDVAIMGAGIPDQIPELIHKIKHNQGEPILHGIHTQGQGPSRFAMPLDLGRYAPDLDTMNHPAFLAIITHHDLARRMSEQEFAPDGYVIEAPTAGGHNAPPRGSAKNERGEPVYTEQDLADLSQMLEMGLTFWLAGQRGTHEDYEDALLSGARGVQVGTAFALAQESGWDPELKRRIIDEIASESGLDVYTDPNASPSGFPIKVGRVSGTVSDADVYAARQRICDIGHLRTAHHGVDAHGKPTIGYQCTAEPMEDYLRKVGAAELPPEHPKRRVAMMRTDGSVCLCNALLAAAGFPRVRDGVAEPAMVTIGDDANRFLHLINTDESGHFDPYKPVTAERVLHYIRTGEKDLDYGI